MSKAKSIAKLVAGAAVSVYAALTIGMVSSSALAAQGSGASPQAFFEQVVNTYDRCRDYYTYMKFSPDYRTISFATDYYETTPTFLYSKGYGLYYLYTTSGAYLGNYMTYMDRYQANYVIY